MKEGGLVEDWKEISTIMHRNKLGVSKIAKRTGQSEATIEKFLGIKRHKNSSQKSTDEKEKFSIFYFA